MKGFVYKITSPSTDKIYVGSTTKTLNQRFSRHKCSDTHNCTSKIILSFDDAVINLIEEVEFEDVKELRDRERYHIKTNADKCINKAIPNRTMKEYGHQYYIDNADNLLKRHKQYKIDNADKIKEQMKNYYITNADKLMEKINCDCGGKYIFTNKSRHLKTQKHQNYINVIM